MIYSTTQDLFDSCMMDVYPNNGAMVDFGINSPTHYAALHKRIRSGKITLEQLNEAMGNGKMITALVGNEVVFHTIYDDMDEDYYED